MYKKKVREMEEQEREEKVAFLKGDSISPRKEKVEKMLAVNNSAKEL